MALNSPETNMPAFDVQATVTCNICFSGQRYTWPMVEFLGVSVVTQSMVPYDLGLQVLWSQ